MDRLTLNRCIVRAMNAARILKRRNPATAAAASSCLGSLNMARVALVASDVAAAQYHAEFARLFLSIGRAIA